MTATLRAADVSDVTAAVLLHRARAFVVALFQIPARWPSQDRLLRLQPATKGEYAHISFLRLAWTWEGLATAGRGPACHDRARRGTAGQVPSRQDTSGKPGAPAHDGRRSGHTGGLPPTRASSASVEPGRATDLPWYFARPRTFT